MNWLTIGLSGLFLYLIYQIMRKNYIINQLNQQTEEFDEQFKIIRDALEESDGMAIFWKSRHDMLLNILVKHGILDLHIVKDENEVNKLLN